MTKVRTPAALCAPDLRLSPDSDAARGEPFVVMSHTALFGALPETGCDACGKPLPVDDVEPSYGVCGHGVYLSVRGDEVRLDAAPLCPSCASAIGMTALARWEIEEEEG